jgi:hypothetical protein
MRDVRNEYEILVEKSGGGERPRGRCRCRWEDNIKPVLKEK